MKDVVGHAPAQHQRVEPGGVGIAGAHQVGIPSDFIDAQDIAEFGCWFGAVLQSAGLMAAGAVPFENVVGLQGVDVGRAGGR